MKEELLNYLRKEDEDEKTEINTVKNAAEATEIV